MKHKYYKGFTLVEMLLVLTIVGAMLYMALSYYQQRTQQMRIDRTVIQTQQILNAGLSFYLAKGRWPTQMSELSEYLPIYIRNNPYGKPYKLSTWNQQTPRNLFVFSMVETGTPSTTLGIATSIAGLLPAAYTTNDQAHYGDEKSTDSPNPEIPPLNLYTERCDPAKTHYKCIVVSAVGIPGQNLNNARAVNFAGLYKHGGCVPVPQCPETMIPQIMVTPASVSGVYDPREPGKTPAVYPISSFTAYATEDFSGNKLRPPACGGFPNPPACPTDPNVAAYWRVCMQVVTEKGDPAQHPTPASAKDLLWGQDVTLQAITRCAVKDEPSGSDFTVFSR